MEEVEYGDAESRDNFIAVGERRRKIDKAKRRLVVVTSKREKIDKEIEILETELKNLGADEFDD